MIQNQQKLFLRALTMAQTNCNNNSSNNKKQKIVRIILQALINKVYKQKKKCQNNMINSIPL